MRPSRRSHQMTHHHGMLWTMMHWLAIHAHLASDAPETQHKESMEVTGNELNCDFFKDQDEFDAYMMDLH